MAKVNTFPRRNPCLRCILKFQNYTKIWTTEPRNFSKISLKAVCLAPCKQLPFMVKFFFQSITHAKFNTAAKNSIISSVKSSFALPPLQKKVSPKRSATDCCAWAEQFLCTSRVLVRTSSLRPNAKASRVFFLSV